MKKVAMVDSPLVIETEISPVEASLPTLVHVPTGTPIVVPSDTLGFSVVALPTRHTLLMLPECHSLKLHYSEWGNLPTLLVVELSDLRPPFQS